MKSLGEQFTMNNIRLNELPEGHTYKYLGQDEAVGYNGQLNKEKFLKNTIRELEKYGHLNFTLEIKLLHIMYSHFR